MAAAIDFRRFGEDLAGAGMTDLRACLHWPATDDRAERQNLTIEREWALCQGVCQHQAWLADLPAWL